MYTKYEVKMRPSRIAIKKNYLSCREAEQIYVKA